MVISPVCLFSQDEVIGEKEKWSWVGRVRGVVNMGNDGRGERGRWTGIKRIKKCHCVKWAQQGQDRIKLNKK